MDDIISTGLIATLLTFGVTGIVITRLFDDTNPACNIHDGYGSLNQWIAIHFYTIFFLGLMQCICYRSAVCILLGYLIWITVMGFGVYVTTTVGRKCIFAEPATSIFSLIALVQIFILFTTQSIIRTIQLLGHRNTAVIYNERPLRITSI